MSNNEKVLDIALDILLEWATECGFGYDNIPEQCAEYEYDIADMRYIEGLKYIVIREAEKKINT